MTVSFQVDEVELLDKRGYLTISLTVAKEGKILLRKPEGIRDWFAALKVFFRMLQLLLSIVYSCFARKSQACVQSDERTVSEPERCQIWRHCFSDSQNEKFHLIQRIITITIIL